jgi:hypothetical protein
MDCDNPGTNEGAVGSKRPQGNQTDCVWPPFESHSDADYSILLQTTENFPPRDCPDNCKCRCPTFRERQLQCLFDKACRDHVRSVQDALSGKCVHHTPRVYCQTPIQIMQMFATNGLCFGQVQGLHLYFPWFKSDKLRKIDEFSRKMHDSS